MSRKKPWPSFGTISFNNDYFKLESRDPYIDVPNYFLGPFISGIQELTERYRYDRTRLYNEAIDLKNQFNEHFEKRYGDWLKVIIKKQVFGSKPFGIQLRVTKWDKFFSFLDNYAERDDILLGG